MTESKKILIVGKNSRIVKDLKDEIRKYNVSSIDYVSHKEICSVDFGLYDYIILFSWSKNIQDNLGILRILPREKLIFVSTTAVFSVAIGRCWNKYPKDKLKIEDLVIRGGGKVVRIGVYNRDVKKRYCGKFLSTSIGDISRYVYKVVRGESLPTIENLFAVSHGKKCLWFERILHKISDILPPYSYIQNIISVILKFAGSVTYGYTRESNNLICEKVQVGWGALGQNISSSISPDLIIVKDTHDEKLPSCCGGLLIPGNPIGLSKYWHGVSIVYRNGVGLIKKVPVYIRRRKFLWPKRKVIIKEQDIYFRDKVSFEISSLNGVGKVPLFYDKAFVCAGCIGNILLLKSCPGSNIGGEVSLDDHIVFQAGSMPSSIAIQRGYIRKFLGIFFIRGRVKRFRNYLVDFRPFSKKDYSHIYSDTTMGILKKIVLRLSFYMINEAFFNKFGVALYTPSVSLHCQALVNDRYKIHFGKHGYTISCIPDSELHKYVNDILSDIANSFEQVRLVPSLSTISGQHLMCRVNVSCPDNIYFLGCPDPSFNLGAIHHTERMIRKAKKHLGSV